MKILLVAPLFPPDTGVSTLRIKFLHDALSEKYEVDVLKLGETNDFSREVKLVDRRMFVSFFSAIFNRQRIFNLFHDYMTGYDLVIVSAAPYGLYEIAHSARKLSIPYILDLRDLPDLTTSEQKGTRPLFWLRTKSWMIDMYIRSTAANAKGLMCVGAISTALTQQKLSHTSCKVINVHNGFEKKDIDFVSHNSSDLNEIVSDELIVGCVGNIFRFRETQTLRDTLIQLNRRKERVTLRHWGKVGPGFADFISHLTNINYVSCMPVSRKVLLNELQAVHCFLLACADDLIWEPTTSVFDYILFRKPVIFTGLRNNEAYFILQNTNTKILELGDLIECDFNSLLNCPDKNEDVLMLYSREFYINRLFSIIGELEARPKTFRLPCPG